MKAWPALLALALLVAPAQPALGGEGPRQDDLGVYHTFDEMVSELENQTAAHPAILRMESIGKTFEGRDIWAVKLSDNASADEAEPNITIFGGIHAGELIGVEVALHILFSLVENYSTDPDVGWYVNSTQLWFVPMLNPDGHVYVEQGNQWRKNRSPNPGGTFGKDLNRNFGHLWGLDASHNPADDDYCGPHAFSENETQAADRLVRAHPPNITLSYHSYGQYILHPWGNNINREPVDPRLSQISWNMSFSMPEGRRYLPMYAREMYSATGDTDDYFYVNLSILPFTIELSTSNRPLDSQVPGICADNYGPVLYVLNYTAGAPPAPPKRSLTLDGPESFSAVPDPYNDASVVFKLSNTGDLDENISLSVWSNSSIWTTAYVKQISPSEIHLEAGRNATITVSINVPGLFPAGEPVRFILNATAGSGANASRSFIGQAYATHSVSMMLDFGKGLVTVHSGQVLTGNLTVRNLGNIPETLALSLNITNATIEADLPASLTLGLGESWNISATIRVPADALGNTRLDLKASYLTRYGDGWTGTTLHVSPSRDLSIPQIQDVTFKEKESVTVPIVIVSRGNTWVNGTLELSGQNPSCRLDRTQTSIPPFSSAGVNLTIGGKRGSGTLDLTFRFDGGNLTQKVRYTIKANETGRTAPYDWTPVLLFLLILVVVAVGIGLWWRFVEVPAGPRRKDGP